jgi:hypothetical protein
MLLIRMVLVWRAVDSQGFLTFDPVHLSLHSNPLISVSFTLFFCITAGIVSGLVAGFRSASALKPIPRDEAYTAKLG